MTDDPLKAVLCSLFDSVMVLSPGGWTQVDLRVAPTPQGLKLAELSSRGEGSEEPRALPHVGIAREHEAMRFSEGIYELSMLLIPRGKHWHGGIARFERGHESADLKLLDGDQTVWLGRLSREELDMLLFTDALFEALAGTEATFQLLQRQVKPGPNLLDLGRYEPLAFDWRWNHADADVRRICTVEARPAGMSAFWRESFACDEGFAWALCSHLCVSLGARGLVRIEGDPVRICAVR